MKNNLVIIISHYGACLIFMLVFTSNELRFSSLMLFSVFGACDIFKEKEI